MSMADDDDDGEDDGYRHPQQFWLQPHPPTGMPYKKRPSADGDENGPNMGKAEHQTMSRKLQRLATSGRDFPLKDYQAQRSWQDKRSWWTKFTLDEACSWLSIKENEYMNKKEVILATKAKTLIDDKEELKHNENMQIKISIQSDKLKKNPRK